jgi:hypothetical protein
MNQDQSYLLEIAKLYINLTTISVQLITLEKS